MTSNRLIHEKSPYLLQHASNPVKWYPWSEEAFAAARAENKPVFLSIGYATCHWCHVMEKESFEDPETARQLNDTFVSIKVDREERPDIDAVYMLACQMLHGSGGWPLTVIMTPNSLPFFAATYLPRHGSLGRMGMLELCQRMRSIWHSDKKKILESAAGITANLGKAFTFISAEDPDAAMLDTAYTRIEKGYDSQWGGFDAAPKFPTPHRLLFLLRYYRRTGNIRSLEMVKHTLIAMRMGGIWDHVGFGFHRYATDKKWLLPHFEKMLYDQALLAMAYLETYQITKEAFFSKTAEEIFTYVLRDMTSEQGAFFTAEDADSEGEEGKFYVWSTGAFRKVLGNEEARFWEKIFNLNDEGNFAEEATGNKSGDNILHLSISMDQWAHDLDLSQDELACRWETVREKLYFARKKRIHPLKDDKILSDWNGLMIAALALGARVLDKPEYKRAAEKAAGFVLTKMRDSQGRLLHRHRDGESAISGFADDYASVVHGLLGLYAADPNPDTIHRAVALQEQMISDYWDHQRGGFFLTQKGGDDLPARPKELSDGALPSANSLALYNLSALYHLTGDEKWRLKAAEQAHAFTGTVRKHPDAYTGFLSGIDFMLKHGKRETC